MDTCAYIRAHTHTHIYIYIYVCVCVCVFICAMLYICVYLFGNVDCRVIKMQTCILRGLDK